MKGFLALIVTLLVAFGPLIIYSCGPSKEEWEAREKQKADSTTVAVRNAVFSDSSSKPYSSYDFMVKEYLINGCEYLGFQPTGKHWEEGLITVIHAGNCNNPIHYKHEKAIQELHSTITKNTTNSPY